MRVRRALARLWRRRDWAQTYPYKPFMGKGLGAGAPR